MLDKIFGSSTSKTAVDLYAVDVLLAAQAFVDIFIGLATSCLFTLLRCDEAAEAISRQQSGIKEKKGRRYSSFRSTFAAVIFAPLLWAGLLMNSHTSFFFMGGAGVVISFFWLATVIRQVMSESEFYLLNGWRQP